MAQHSMSTFVSVAIDKGDEVAAAAALHQLAIERLGGEEGLQCVGTHVTGGHLCGTFTRAWETPEPQQPKGKSK